MQLQIAFGSVAAATSDAPKMRMQISLLAALLRTAAAAC